MKENDRLAREIMRQKEYHDGDRQRQIIYQLELQKDQYLKDVE